VCLALVCAAASLLATNACRGKELRSVDATKFSDEAGEEAAQRMGRIETEIAALGAQDPWAGDYFCGDGLGVRLLLQVAPNAGFLFEHWGCLGLYDRNWGEIDERDGALAFTCHFVNEREGPFFHSAYVPAKWGERRYLIAPRQMKSFCNAVNMGDEPRASGYGDFLLRRNESETPPTGLPELPREFASMVRDHPLQASVVAVQVGRFVKTSGVRLRTTVVTLDVGSKDGAWEGMELFVIGQRLISKLTISKCQDSHCSAESNFRVDEQLPEIGWKLASRPPDR